MAEVSQSDICKTDKAKRSYRRKFQRNEGGG